MKFEHDGPSAVHPWEIVQRMPTLLPQPLPVLIPGEWVSLEPIPDVRIQTAVPQGAVHNGFIPPSRVMPVQIVQPRPQNGDRRGKRG